MIGIGLSNVWRRKGAGESGPPAELTIDVDMTHGTVGVPYVGAIIASGGRPPYVYSLSSGALPQGLSLDPATGVVSGIPTGAEDAPVVFAVTDGAGQTVDSGPMQVEIVAPPASFTASSWRLVSTSRNPGGDYMGVCRIQFYYRGVMLPFDGTTTSDSSHVSATRTARYAYAETLGNPQVGADGWTDNGGTANAWARCDFPAPVSVDTIAVTPMAFAARTPKNFKIQALVDGAWIDVVVVSDVAWGITQQTFEVQPPITGRPISARYWRVFMPVPNPVTPTDNLSLGRLWMYREWTRLPYTGAAFDQASMYNGRGAALTFQNTDMPDPTSAAAGWTSAIANPINQWIECDFGAVRDVDSVVFAPIMFRAGARNPQTLEIQCSDDRQLWTTLVHATGLTWADGAQKRFVFDLVRQP